MAIQECESADCELRRGGCAREAVVVGALAWNEKRGKMMATVLDLPWWHWALAVCFAVCSVAGVYVVLKARKEWKETPPGASDMMANFRELRSQGELSEQEFRTIKTLLADELAKELKDHGKAP